MYLVRLPKDNTDFEARHILYKKEHLKAFLGLLSCHKSELLFNEQVRNFNKLMRNKNVSKIGSLICEKQIKFLTKNSIDPEPLSGKEIAKELNLSTSTVSRIIRAKYIQYDDGLLPMKSLLAPSVSKSKKITSRNLIREIDLIVKSSQKRLSDQMITNLLNKKGYGLARRTINKYRQKSIRLEVGSSKGKTINERS